jgi:hypothetical protein
MYRQEFNSTIVVSESATNAEPSTTKTYPV